MKTRVFFLAIAGIAFLGGCRAPDHVERFDSGGFNLAMSATRDERELGQSLAAISMMNDLRAGERLALSPRAQAVITAYAN